MSTVHTLSSLATQHHAGSASSGSQPTLRLFPITADHDQSKFKDIQVGPNRTTMPSWKTKEEERAWRKEHLVLCLRALHRQGLAEGAAGKSSFPVRTATPHARRPPVDPRPRRATYLLGEPAGPLIRPLARLRPRAHRQPDGRGRRASWAAVRAGGRERKQHSRADLPTAGARAGPGGRERDGRRSHCACPRASFQG